MNVEFVFEEDARSISPSQVSNPLTLPSFDEAQPSVQRTALVAPETDTIEGVPDSVHSMQRKVKCAFQF